MGVCINNHSLILVQLPSTYNPKLLFSGSFNIKVPSKNDCLFNAYSVDPTGLEPVASPPEADRRVVPIKCGGPYRARTGRLRVANAALYQMS